MIGVFPTLYPDELVYSCLARYAAYTGYIVYRSAAEDLFRNRLHKPSVEFMTPLNDDARARLSTNHSMADIVQNHTMFDYYARFASAEKRNALMDMLISGNMMGFINGISVRSKLGERFLRFCPVCTQGDRDKYGETYWHRIHQFPEIKVCPIHGCMLHKTDVSLSGAVSPAFYPAQLAVPYDAATVPCGNKLERDIAGYAAAVFRSGYDRNAAVSIGSYLYRRLEGTKYCTARGEARYLTQLTNDIRAYYAGLDMYGFSEAWQMSKLFTGHRHNFYEVCLVAYFLGIQPCELSCLSLPDEKQHERFDRLVHELHTQGLSSLEVGRRLGASPSTVLCVLNGKRHHESDAAGPRRAAPRKNAVDWDTLDANTLPSVMQLVPQLQRIGSSSRPVYLTPSAVSRYLGLKEGRILKMPQCLQYVQSHMEPYEVYCARCLVWAYHQLAGQSLTQKKLQLKLNTRKALMLRALPHLNRFAPSEVAAAIREVIRR